MNKTSNFLFLYVSIFLFLKQVDSYLLQDANPIYLLYEWFYFYILLKIIMKTRNYF